MKHSIFRLIYILIPVALICFLAVSAFAGEIIEGQVKADKNINLLNVKIEVSAYEQGENGWYYGSRPIAIFTDKDGYFSFERPEGDYYTCELVTESLPSGYGAERISIDGDSSGRPKNGFIFKIEPVAEVRTSYDNGHLSASFYGENGQPLSRRWEYIDSTGEKYEYITYEALNDLDTVIYTGKILVGMHPFDYSAEDDISDRSKGDKMSYLKSEGLISQDKYYSLWLDYREDGFDETDISYDYDHGGIYWCGNLISAMEEEIRVYANKTEDAELKSRIQSTLGISTSVYETEASPESGSGSADDLDESSVETDISPESTDKSVSDTADTGASNGNGRVTVLVLIILCVIFFALGFLMGIRIRRK
ncbi:MAG: hypothetical protein IJZ89_04945 [Clostridia bacterium]|nr:hypothetical protein [Clostridia bacterium]